MGGDAVLSVATDLSSVGLDLCHRYCRDAVLAISTVPAPKVGTGVTVDGLTLRPLHL